VSDVALLVSTYQSPRALELVLGSVLRQSRLPDEVLVADDGSGEDTRAVVDAAGRRLAEGGVPLRHLWHEDRGFRAGGIRNKALSAATSAYVVQIDGDVVLHPRFIEQHVAWARPGYFLCGRRADLTPECTAGIKASTTFPDRFRARDFQQLKYAFYVPPLTPLFLRQYARSHTKGVMGSNMSYWLDDALRVNGYDEDFEGWGKEDNDFALRLLNSGVRRRTLVGSALQYHLHHPRNDRSRLDENTTRLDHARLSGRTRCANGIVKE
jgi:glycosyltransferase involved in cell wall biosynthesis